jgi:hypothetical protein
MNILLEMQRTHEVSEAYGYMMRRGKMTRVLRGAGGRFGFGGAQTRADASIGARERRQARSVQGGESLSSVSKAKRKLGTRRGMLTSRERQQVQGAGGGRQGSRYGAYRSATLGGRKTSFSRYKGKIKRGLTAAQQVAAARKAVGLSGVGKRQMVNSVMGRQSAARLRKVRSILKRISMGSRRRRRR